MIKSSPSMEDLLPGLCKLTERWLREVVFARFRDTRYSKATLEDYFSDSDVRRYIERSELRVCAVMYASAYTFHLAPWWRR